MDCLAQDFRNRGANQRLHRLHTPRIREGKWYYPDLLRRLHDYPDIKPNPVAEAPLAAGHHLIEYAGTGVPLAQELYNERLVRLSLVRPESNKVTRAIAQQARRHRRPRSPPCPYPEMPQKRSQ